MLWMLICRLLGHAYHWYPVVTPIDDVMGSGLHCDRCGHLVRTGDAYFHHFSQIQK